MSATSLVTGPERRPDLPAIREVLPAASPAAPEADLVDALRRNPSRLPGLPVVTEHDGRATGSTTPAMPWRSSSGTPFTTPASASSTPPRTAQGPFDVPGEAMMALVLDERRPVPTGTIACPPLFGP